MKKLLLTLCAVFAGVAAYAGNLEMSLVDAEGNVTNEVTVAPGAEVTMHASVDVLVGCVDGFQLQFKFDNDAFQLKNLGTAFNKKYFNPEGMSTLDGDALASTINEGNYRIIATNTSLGVFWGTAEGLAERFGMTLAEVQENLPAEAYTLGNVFTFTVQVPADWDGEFVMLDFDDAYGIFQMQGVGQVKIPEGALDLKIKNANYTPSVQDLTGEIVVSEPTEDGLVTVSYNGPEDVTITVNGEEYTEPIQLVDGDNVLNVVVSAEGYNNLEETFTINWEQPAIQTPAPEIVVTEGEDAYTFLATGEGTITLFCDGIEVENPYTVARTEVDQVVMLYAMAHVDGQTDGVTSGEYIVPALGTPQLPDLEGNITVGEPNEEGVVTIEYTGNENVTVTVTINGEPAEEPYQLVDGMNTIVVTVEGEGFNPMTETFEVEWNAPEPPEDPHMVGKWIVFIDKAGEEHWTALNADPIGENNWSTMLTLHHNPWAENVPFYFMVDGVQMGAESDMYLPAMGDFTQTVLNPVFVGENMFYVPATYTYTFGLQLKDGQYYLLVAQGPQTAVNEINGGKAVAGVRYFNMAGQEMQEANGMTIVVTTYTDGTTSAVKVMK